MKPDDTNGNRPLSERPFRVLVIAGSNRRQYNCPGVDSKSRALMFRVADRLPQEWEIDLEDLGNVYARTHIQGCNACVSTSMALCCWPCNCYEKGSKAEPDLMWELDLYARRDSYAPLVWQCRYGGVEVPDALWRYVEFGVGKKYSDNQAEHLPAESEVFRALDEWTDGFADFVRAKGKVPPGKYRAFGYEAPKHKWADLKLAWRDLSMRVGHAPEGSSPRAQHEMGLNRDDQLRPDKGEGKRLRED